MSVMQWLEIFLKQNLIVIYLFVSFFVILYLVATRLSYYLNRNNFKLVAAGIF